MADVATKLISQINLKLLEQSQMVANKFFKLEIQDLIIVVFQTVIDKAMLRDIVMLITIELEKVRI